MGGKNPDWNVQVEITRGKQEKEEIIYGCNINCWRDSATGRTFV
jgi:hypothetical protein